MPIVRVEMFEGRTLDQKRELVRVLTQETSRIIGCDAASVYVVIDEVRTSNWGVGGVLCADKYPDRAARV